MFNTNEIKNLGGAKMSQDFSTKAKVSLNLQNGDLEKAVNTLSNYLLDCPEKDDIVRCKQMLLWCSTRRGLCDIVSPLCNVKDINIFSHLCQVASLAMKMKNSFYDGVDFDNDKEARPNYFYAPTFPSMLGNAITGLLDVAVDVVNFNKSLGYSKDQELRIKMATKMQRTAEKLYSWMLRWIRWSCYALSMNQARNGDDIIALNASDELRGILIAFNLRPCFSSKDIDDKWGSIVDTIRKQLDFKVKLANGKTSKQTVAGWIVTELNDLDNSKVSFTEYSAVEFNDSALSSSLPKIADAFLKFIEEHNLEDLK